MSVADLTAFQLPLSGSREAKDRRGKGAEALRRLSTPSLGITLMPLAAASIATRFQLPLSGSRCGLDEHPVAPGDPVFQLPLSGSLDI